MGVTKYTHRGGLPLSERQSCSFCECCSCYSLSQLCALSSVSSRDCRPASDFVDGHLVHGLLLATFAD